MVRIDIRPSSDRSHWLISVNGESVACARDYESADVVGWQVERQIEKESVNAKS